MKLVTTLCACPLAFVVQQDGGVYQQLVAKQIDGFS